MVNKNVGKQNFRTFSLNRILSVESLNESFAPLPCPKEPDDTTNLTRFILRFSKNAAYRVYDEFDISQIHLFLKRKGRFCIEMTYEFADIIKFL